MSTDGAEGGAQGASSSDVVLGGAITTLVVWILVIFGVETPPTVAAAMATLVGWGVGFALHKRRTA